MSEEPKRRPGRPRLHPEDEALTDRIGLRAPPSLRARLDAAAEANGRSLSTEAQVRLERSFDDLLDGPARPVLRRLVTAFGASTDTNDPVEFIEATRSIIEALMSSVPRTFRPREVKQIERAI